MTKQAFIGASTGLVAVAFGVLAALAALPSSASGDYAFLIRTNVESVNTANNTIQATGLSSSTKAITDTQSKTITYSLKNAKVYRWEQNKTVKVERNINWIKPGQEVVLRGNKTSGSFLVTEATINDTSFEVVGRVTDYDTSNNWIEILIGRSTLQHAGVANTRVKFHYTSTTTCMRLGSEIGCSEVTTQDQGAGKGIKVKGAKSPATGQWDITNAWTSYPI